MCCFQDERKTFGIGDSLGHETCYNHSVFKFQFTIRAFVSVQGQCWRPHYEGQILPLNNPTSAHLLYLCVPICGQLEEFQMLPDRFCKNGFSPVHEAARRASFDTMLVLTRWAARNGRSLMQSPDSEGNLPLHLAVHSGDVKVSVGLWSRVRRNPATLHDRTFQ